MSPSLRSHLSRICSLCALMGFGSALSSAAEDLVDDYLERYFDTFPSAATAAGRHDLDDRLESLSPDEIQKWIRFNRETLNAIAERSAGHGLDLDEQLDLELLERQARREVFKFHTVRIAERDPLFWTDLIGNATVFLLVRDDAPRTDRLTGALARAAALPHLISEARAALGATESHLIASEICELAASQARATASFYREGFHRAAPGDSPLAVEMQAAGAVADTALTALAEDLDRLARRASGSFRLAERYAESLRLVTGIEQAVPALLQESESALAAKRRETAAYGREIWTQVFPEQPQPESEAEVVAVLFERLGEDRATSVEEFIEDYRDLVERSIEFVRRYDVITMPEPLTLVLDRSPSYFVGQSVGGVYAAGPYGSPTSPTLLFLPTPAYGAGEAELEAFFRDFNHHFNVMITPHELVPGHYLQLKLAARHPHKIRALFGDGVYIEGWGTFAERLMLDLGWGGPLARLAHLKKQMENIARTIVDIRVHTDGWSREEVVRFVRDEAFQDEQFAANMWRRAMTSTPQLTFYYLGYREVWGLYEAVRRGCGSDFELKAFMDGMMELGPVGVHHYRRLLLGDRGPGETSGGDVKSVRLE